MLLPSMVRYQILLFLDSHDTDAMAINKVCKLNSGIYDTDTIAINKLCKLNSGIFPCT